MELPRGEREKPGTKPGTRKRTRLEIARDRTDINHMRLMERRTISEISAFLCERYLLEADPDTGLNKEGKRPPSVRNKQVTLELGKAIDDFKESRADEIHAKRLTAIRQYEAMAGLAYREYQASKAPRVVSTETETTGGEAGTINQTREVIEARVTGDKGFLNIVLECTNRVAELEAIIPPRKTAFTNPEGTEPFKFEGTEEMKRLGALAQQLLHPESGDKLKEL